MENKKNLIWPVLLWGSVWGAVEATLGWVLHFIDLFPGFSAIILFPPAVYFMKNVYMQTGSAFSVFAAALTAAAIKAVDFLFPALPFIKTFNPVTAIIAEGLLAALLIKYIISPDRLKIVPAVLAASLGWRVVFLLVNVPVLILISDGILIYGFINALRFLLFDGTLNAVFASLICLVPVTKKTQSNFKPVFAALALFGAVSIEIFFLLA